MDTQAQAALDALFAALSRQRDGPVVLQLYYADGRVQTYSLAAQPGGQGGGAPGDAPRAGAGGLRQLVRQALREAGGPLKAAGIARRLKRSYSGHFRTVLAAMTDAGELVRLPDGRYDLPGGAR